MKRLKPYVFSILLLFLSSVCIVRAQSGSSSTVTGHIFAEVIAPLSAVETSQLNFGRFSPGPQGGSLIVNPENTVSVLGSVWPGRGLHSAASFFVSGDPGMTYTISLPSEPVTISHVSSARTMKVTDWRSVPDTQPGAGLLENGAQTVWVGATLQVGTITDNPVGIYTGTYLITFDFN